jgi:hypothetical protein
MRGPGCAVQTIKSMRSRGGQTILSRSQPKKVGIDLEAPRIKISFVFRGEGARIHAEMGYVFLSSEMRLSDFDSLALVRSSRYERIADRPDFRFEKSKFSIRA